MGQANKRGNKDQRIAQALELQKQLPEDQQQITFIGSSIRPNLTLEQMELSKTPPEVGFYLATKLDEHMEVYVSEVSEPEDDGFHLVLMCTDNDPGWPDAIETELTNEEWFDFSHRYGLIPSPYDIEHNHGR